MKIKSILAFFILAFASLSAYAAVNLPNKCEAALPRVLSTPLIQKQTIDAFLKKGNWGQNDTKDNYWQVYSDREGNVAYSEPDAKSPRQTLLKMNESLRIAKIVNGFALVYRETEKTSFPQISRPEWKGWVPMSHLLLWASCPTDKIGIYQKALPIINVDKVDKSRESEIGLCYNNPEDKTGATRINSGVEFFFVMKEAPNGLVLLSREAKLKGITDQVLLGWVSPMSFVNWNQRVCLEPNWDREAGAYFEENKVEIPVFNDKDLKEKICTMPAGEKNKYSGEETRYRMHGESMRYPVLPGRGDDRNIYRVTAFCSPEGKGHVVRGTNGGDLSAEKEALLKDISTINLLIVIDGTSSMKGYFDAVQKQIMNANAYFSAQSASNTVRVGIVIYRDYPDGEFVTQSLALRPCSNNDKELKEFLATGGGYGIRSVAKSAEEALFCGINLALDGKLMGYNPRQSNLMFIIGDCGNALDDKKFTEEQLIKKVIENKVEISSFQVYNAPSQPYKLFVQQTSNIIMKSLALMYMDEQNKNSVWREVQNGYEYVVSKASNINKYYMGNIRYAANGEKMNLSTLLSLMQDSFIQFSKSVDNKKKSIVNMNSDVAGMYAGTSITEQTAAGKADYAFYKKMFSEKMWQLVKQNNMLTAKEGYTAIHDKASGYDFWKPVIYISQEELNELLSTFRPVMDAADGDDRMPYVNAMKQVAQTIAGNNDVSSMTDKEIRALIAGLDAQSASLQSGKTLGQILDKNAVKPAEYKAMMQEFKSKFNRLDKKMTSAYPFSAERNGTRWFWIPVEELP